jgi:hypothetical protein
MFSIKNLFILATAASAAVLPRSVAVLESDITNLNRQINTVANDVSSGPINSIPIGVDVIALHGIYLTAITDAQESLPLTDNAAVAVLNYYYGGVFQSSEAALSIVIDRAPAFKLALETGFVLNDLKTLRADSASYIQALAALSDYTATAFLQYGQALDNAFARAIYLYSN